MNSGYDINQLVQAAQSRWLKPAEVLFILKNHDANQITQKSPEKPPSGSLFLFNRRVLRFFRKDGHNWRKKKDGKNVGEAHERLKVDNVEALNCYYAHGEDNPNFQRRSFWILDPALEHIVLVHYRDITEGASNSGCNSEFSPGRSHIISQNTSNFASQNHGTTSASDLQGSYHSHSSPVSVEVSSATITDSHGSLNNSPETGVVHALKRLEEQLSLDDDKFKEYIPFGNQSLNNFAGSSSLYGSHHSLSSPGTVEVSSRVAESQALDVFSDMDGAKDISSSPETEVNHTLRRLEEQLSLDDKRFKEYVPYDNQIPDEENCAVVGYERGLRKLDQHTDLQQGQCYGRDSELFIASATPAPWGGIGASTRNQHHLLGRTYEDQSRESMSWNDVLDLSNSPSLVSHQDNETYSVGGQGKQSSAAIGAVREQDFYLHQHSDGSNSSNSAMLTPQDNESFNLPAYSPGITSVNNIPGCYSTTPEPGQFEIPLSEASGLTIAQEQKFKIREISPEWGFANEVTKVIIIGSFLCNPSQLSWACMFGDIEVPVQIMQDGVLCCQSPPSCPGKVTICITSGNREACSEIRAFEYRDSHNTYNNYVRPPKEDSKSIEELLLVVRLGQMLLSDSNAHKREDSDLETDTSGRQSEDSWVHIIEALLTGSETTCGIMDGVLQELMKDKLQTWLSSRPLKENDNSGCALTKKEQGIIHIIAGLGYEWSLSAILASGVGVNFRDINGWTALHWAARFGREKMVAALIACGASAGAVTDPTVEDPVGKTPASIASAYGHKGIAGYLSELALTSHLSSLTLEETELSKGSAVVEAEATVSSISSGIASGQDQYSMKQTLSAVRNAAQAAARIQSAFRAHSFRKRHLREAATFGDGMDEYGFSPDEIQGLSAASKLVFRHLHDHSIAALSIQKNFRGWKDRKDFLSLRQKVVKIQAHIRGYQVRKKYRAICWAVGIFDKVVLRWRRKGAGLRRYSADSKAMDEEEEDEDILKSFRKQKVDVALDEDVSRVLSMVDSPEAREQYNRMLEGCQRAKAELGILRNEAATSTSETDVLPMDNDDTFLLPQSFDPKALT